MTFVSLCFIFFHHDSVRALCGALDFYLLRPGSVARGCRRRIGARRPRWRRGGCRFDPTPHPTADGPRPAARAWCNPGGEYFWKTGTQTKAKKQKHQKKSQHTKTNNTKNTNKNTNTNTNNLGLGVRSRGSRSKKKLVFDDRKWNPNSYLNPSSDRSSHHTARIPVPVCRCLSDFLVTKNFPSPSTH